MDRKANTTRWASLTLTVGLSLAASAAMAAATPNDEKRVSESAYFADDSRAQASPNRTSTDEFDAIPSGGNRVEGTRGSEQRKLSSNESRTPNTDFWFYDADIQLFADDDRDGYFHGIDLLFDADTYYVRADVYAVVYLSLDGGPWIEYAETEDFAIWGTSASDEYVIVTELLSGYPTGSYDVLIELFDAFDNSFVADIGPDISSELAYLPLEDAGRDLPSFGPQPPISVSHGGGGSADWLTVFALGLLVAGAVRRQRLQPTAAQHHREPSA